MANPRGIQTLNRLVLAKTDESSPKPGGYEDGCGQMMADREPGIANLADEIRGGGDQLDRLFFHKTDLAQPAGKVRFTRQMFDPNKQAGSDFAQRADTLVQAVGISAIHCHHRTGTPGTWLIIGCPFIRFSCPASNIFQPAGRVAEGLEFLNAHPIRQAEEEVGHLSWCELVADERQLFAVRRPGWHVDGALAAK